MKWKWMLVKLIAFVGLLVAVIILTKSNISLRKNAERNERNVEILTDSLHRSMLHDSIPVVSTGAIEQTKKEFQKTQTKTVQTAKDLGIKSKDITTAADIGVKTEGTIKYVLKDSTFDYRDKWAHFRASTKDSTFYYAVRDSLSMLVNRVYKHKFLFLRWGLKGYNVTVTNFNPNGKVEYLRYIEIK
jgi:hypothetical protein